MSNNELDKAAEEFAKTQPEWCMTHVAYRAGFEKAIELLGNYEWPEDWVGPGNARNSLGFYQACDLLETFAGVTDSKKD